MALAFLLFIFFNDPAELRICPGANNQSLGRDHPLKRTYPAMLGRLKTDLIVKFSRPGISVLIILFLINNSRIRHPVMTG